MSAVYANWFRFEFDTHQVRLVFFDQHKDHDGYYANETGTVSDKVADVAMTRQSFHALMEIINQQMAPNLPPLAVPGQPYPPAFAEDTSWQGRAGSGGDASDIDEMIRRRDPVTGEPM